MAIQFGRNVTALPEAKRFSTMIHFKGNAMVIVVKVKGDGMNTRFIFEKLESSLSKFP